MDDGVVRPLEEEFSSLSISTNSKIAELLELCIQPENKEELDRILSKFWNEFEKFSAKETFCEFDFACLYAFNYVYQKNIGCVTAVARSTYAYLDQNIFALNEENRNRFIDCGNECFLKGLRKFTNFNCDEGMQILVQSQIGNLIYGNEGFAYFLAKFALVDFPCEANEKSRKMLAELVHWFNNSHHCYYASNSQSDEDKTILLDELINLMTQSEISFRRCMLIFCTICIVVEYGMYEKLCMIDEPELGISSFMSGMKSKSLTKMSILDLYIDTTAEAKVTFGDLENFSAIALNPRLGREFGKRLVKTSRKIMCEEHGSYNPRSLKDLSRTEVRAGVPTSMTLTEQIKQLHIPDCSLKEFILFHRGDVWKLVVEHQVHLHSFQLLSHRASQANEGHNLEN